EKVAELEAEYGHLRDQVESSAALDARLSELSYQVDSELYPHMLTAVAGRRWVISHGLRLAFMKCCGFVKYQTALGKVVSLAIDQGIQYGLKVGIDHARLKDAPLERIMDSLYLEGFPSPEDETPDFRRLQPILEQHRQAASSSLSIVPQDQGISTPHVADVPPLNSIAVEAYTLFDVSMLKTTAEFGPPNPSSINDQSEVAQMTCSIQLFLISLHILRWSLFAVSLSAIFEPILTMVLHTADHPCEAVCLPLCF
ncbi:hypothetical protein Tco_1559996, partial [Tanacetum coccineum]